MPMARISLNAGKSATYLKELSDNLHEALVETFGIPRQDRFHIIEQRGPGELIYDPTYLVGPRSEDYVLIVVTGGKPRTVDVKRAFYRRLADRLGKAPGIRPQDVMVIVQTTGVEDWSFGNGEATLV